MIAVVSVSILGITPCMEHLRDLEDQTTTELENAPYIVNPTAIFEISKRILSIADQVRLLNNSFDRFSLPSALVFAVHLASQIKRF
jgi:hypothetical protein